MRLQADGLMLGERMVNGGYPHINLTIIIRQTIVVKHCLSYEPGLCQRPASSPIIMFVCLIFVDDSPLVFWSGLV